MQNWGQTFETGKLIGDDKTNNTNDDKGVIMRVNKRPEFFLALNLRTSGVCGQISSTKRLEEWRGKLEEWIILIRLYGLIISCFTGAGGL